jgi:hypothetical protein
MASCSGRGTGETQATKIRHNSPERPPMDVADYFRLRDAAVLVGGQEFHRFLVSQGRYKSPEQEEITLHKMRTAITTMPEEMRAASKAWLESKCAVNGTFAAALINLAAVKRDANPSIVSSMYLTQRFP